MEDEGNTEKVTIGYLIPFIWGDLSLSLIKGVHEKAKQLDVNLVCIVGQRLNDTSSEFTKQANVAYDLVSKDYIKGVVVWGSQITARLSERETSKFYKKLKNIPVVGILTPIEDCYNVTTDVEESIQVIMEHLILDHGYKKIGFICATKGHYASESKLEAYKESLKFFGLKYKPELVSDYYDFSIEAGRKGARQLLEKRGLQAGIDIEAIITPNDIIAFGVCEELRNLGIKCPEEIAIVGFNNNNESRICKPSLTSVDPSIAQQGDKAVGLLVDIIKNNIQPKDTTVPGRLIIRNSCGCKELNLSEIKIQDNNAPFEITKEQIRETIKNIEKKIMPFYYTVDSSWVENMVLSFIYDMENDNTERFLSILDVYIDIIFSHNEDVSNLQNIITLIRNEISPRISDCRSLLKASDIWNKARIAITQVAELVAFDKLTNDDKTLFIIYSTEQKLMSTFILEEFLDIMELIVKDINVRSCYIATYDKQEDLLKKVKLIFAYNENMRIKIEEDYYFNPKEIVPKEFRPTDRRYTYIVNVLYYKDIQLGFVIYETNIMDKFFDTLSGQISSTLYRIKMFRRLKEAEDEKGVLFKELEEKNFELEKKIEERTAAIHNVNKELQYSIIKANTASEAKSRFLANMSHEIRTPLNCIIGFSEILGSIENSSEQYKRYTSLIAQEADKLLRLINEILDISKIEAGKITLSKDVFDIHNAIESITSTYCILAETKRLYYHVYGLDIIPRLVIGDCTRFKQILTNILSNAIKFTNKGGVTLSLEIATESEKEIEILFNINDTGIGIKADKQDVIFENFIQADNSTSHEYGGTGLGISISKQLVELMGGNIGVDSTENYGSTFWFTITFEKCDSIEENKENYKTTEKIDISTKELRNSTIMIVEDYAVNRELIKIYLDKIGCKVIETTNGKNAVDLFLTNNIDLILMDIQIDEMDGCEATQIIRKSEKGRDIPIIGISANVFGTDIKKYISIGMNDVIIKPFKKDDFQYKVVFWLNKSHHLSDIEQTGYMTTLDMNIEKSIEEDQFIDIKRNLRELDGDIKFFVSITTEFLQNTQNQIPILVLAAKNKNYELLMNQAHSIKGGALNLSAKPLFEIAKAIEEKGRYNDSTGIDSLIKNLEITIIKTQAYLRTKVN